MLGNTKAIAQAERLVYVEDQYLWSEEVGEHFAGALRDEPRPPADRRAADGPGPRGRDRRGPAALRAVAWRCGRSSRPAADRVAFFGLTNEQGLPVYVHSKTCIIDHRWASVGSDNLNRRSWTSDSEIACTVLDDRGELGDPAPEDSFPRVLLRTLVAEHLGCHPDEVPEDPHELFDAMVASRGRARRVVRRRRSCPAYRRARPGLRPTTSGAGAPVAEPQRPRALAPATPGAGPGGRVRRRRPRRPATGGSATATRGPRAHRPPSCAGRRACTTCCSTRTVGPRPGEGN